MIVCHCVLCADNAAAVICVLSDRHRLIITKLEVND